MQKRIQVLSSAGFVLRFLCSLLLGFHLLFSFFYEQGHFVIEFAYGVG